MEDFFSIDVTETPDIHLWDPPLFPHAAPKAVYYISKHVQFLRWGGLAPRPTPK
jgi:hypothetical protein